MLLYRIIPNSWATFFETKMVGKPSLTTEELFYKLGYINISEHEPYYIINTDVFLQSGISWQSKGEKGIFFFKSPWDCIKTFKYVNDEFYTDKIGTILEYDIPDSIITNYSSCGNGLYAGEEIPEVKIPLSIIKGADASRNLNPDLLEQLQKLEQEQIEESNAIIKETITNPDEEKMLTILNTPEKRERISSWRMSNCGVFWKSNYITGRNCTVTREAIKLYERQNNPESLISQGNGIFLQTQQGNDSRTETSSQDIDR